MNVLQLKYPSVKVKKNVLIISYTYPPANAPAAQRPYVIAKYLDKSKYDVTVITCGNADSSLGFDENFNEELDAVKLVKIDAPFGSKSTALRAHKMSSKKQGFKSKLKSRLLGLISYSVVPDRGIIWYPSVVKYLKKNRPFVENLDIVFSTSPFFTNHLIGKYIKKSKPSVKWLVDVRDFHYVEHLEYTKGIKRYLNKRVERSVFNKADSVIFISNAMREVYAGYYTKMRSKMEVVYNGFDLEDFKDLTIEKLDGDFLSIFYAGSFYGGVRSPLPLFRLLDAVFEKGLIRPEAVKVNIAGTLEPELREQIEAFKSSVCLNFMGKIPRSEALDILTKSSLLWLIVSKKITHYTGVPIKLYEYMAARRPIINFAPDVSEPSAMIIDNKLGWNFDEDQDSMDEMVGRFEEVVIAHNNGNLRESLSDQLLKEYSRKEQTLLIQTLFNA